MLAIVVAGLSQGAPVLGGEYTYVNIASTGGDFVSDIDSTGDIALNNNGTVAFFARIKVDYYYFPAAVLTGAGDGLSTIARSRLYSGDYDTPFSDIYTRHLDINDLGQVAFFGTGRTPDDPDYAVYRSSGGDPTVIAGYDWDSPLRPEHQSLIAINNAGTVVYQVGGGGERRLYAGNTLIAAGASTAFSRTVRLNNQGAILFSAYLDDSIQGGLAMYDGGTITPVTHLDVPSGGLWTDFDFNDAGTIAHGGVKTTTIDGWQTTIATGMYLPEDLRINSSGRVAFSTPDEIYTGSGGRLSEVITIGSPLFGSTVTELFYNKGGASNVTHDINDLGSVAFRYTLADGRTGVARADFNGEIQRRPVLLTDWSSEIDPPFHKDQLQIVAGGGQDSAIGVISSLSGDVQVLRANGQWIAAEVGTPIYLGDRVETFFGETNITFVDETEFTISEDTSLTVDEYVFDPGTERDDLVGKSLIRSLFSYSADLLGREDLDGVNTEVPVGSLGIRGALNPAGFSAGSPVTLYTVVEMPDEAFELSFFYAFLDASGSLEVEIDGVSLLTLHADPDQLGHVLQHTLEVDDPELLQMVLAELAFTYDGDTGSEMFLDNITMPGLDNGEFTDWDDGWFSRGEGEVNFFATVSEVPEPASVALLSLAGLTLLRRGQRHTGAK